MKPSHMRTPRTLAECYFEEGYGSVEPAMWGKHWNSSVKPDTLVVSLLQWKTIVPFAIIVFAAVGFIVNHFV